MVYISVDRGRMGKKLDGRGYGGGVGGGGGAGRPYGVQIQKHWHATIPG